MRKANVRKKARRSVLNRKKYKNIKEKKQQKKLSKSNGKRN
jgi:hypothetical protein